MIHKAQFCPVRPDDSSPVTALAHKLSRVLWHLLQFKQEFDGKVFAKEKEKMKRKKVAASSAWPRP